MYIGTGIEGAIKLLINFLDRNLQVAYTETRDNNSGSWFEPILYIPDSFGELMQMEKSISGLWGLGDVYFALKDAQGSKLVCANDIDSCSRFFKVVYEKRKSKGFWGLPDRIRVPVIQKVLNKNEPAKKSEVIEFLDRDINDPAHIVASLYYVKMAGYPSSHAEEIINNILNSWYEDTPEAKGPGWPIFPKNCSEEVPKENKLVDFIATIQVVCALAEVYKEGNARLTEIIKTKASEMKKAWVFSLMKAEELSNPFKFTYSDACRALLSLSRLLGRKEALTELLDTNEQELKSKVNNLLEVVFARLRSDMITSRRIHDRSSVYRRSDGMVVQYIGVGSAFILYTVLVALDVLGRTQSDIQGPVVRTLVVQVLQQIVTEDHIHGDKTHTLEKFAPYNNFNILGAYVFDESAPDRPDAHEFIFFWQSAYALQALIQYARMLKSLRDGGVDRSCLEALRDHLDMEKRFWNSLATIRFWHIASRVIRSRPVKILVAVYTAAVGYGIFFLLKEFYKLASNFQKWIVLAMVVLAFLMMLSALPIAFWFFKLWIKGKAKERSASAGRPGE